MKRVTYMSYVTYRCSVSYITLSCHTLMQSNAECKQHPKPIASIWFTKKKSDHVWMRCVTQKWGMSHVKADCTVPWYVTWLIDMWHDSLICDMTHWCVNESCHISRHRATHFWVALCLDMWHEACHMWRRIALCLDMWHEWVALCRDMRDMRLWISCTVPWYVTWLISVWGDLFIRDVTRLYACEATVWAFRFHFTFACDMTRFVDTTRFLLHHKSGVFIEISHVTCVGGLQAVRPNSRLATRCNTLQHTVILYNAL